MSRTTIAWIALGLTAVAAGCRMCASPYDYCSPTFMGTCGEDCAPFVRAGSILSARGEGPAIVSEGYADHHAAEEEQIARIQIDYRSASPILAAATGQNSEAAPQTGPTLAAEQAPTLAVEEQSAPAAEEGPKLAVEAQSAPAVGEEGPKLAVEFEDLPSDGWRAKR